MSLFDTSERAERYRIELLEFMESHVYPAESVYEQQMIESGDPHFQPPILDELKAEARRRGLWNLFHPHPEWGPGLTNLGTRRWPRSWAAAISRRRRATATRPTPAIWKC